MLANTLWGLASLPEAVRFRGALRRPGATQRRVLHRILRSNAASDAGQTYGFASIDDVSDYQERVPLTTYEDVEADVSRIAEGEDHVLTTDAVRLLEPTSGSTAATKWVPYTDALRREFQQAIAPWIVDLFRHYPRLLGGAAYWSVSPIGERPEETEGGVPLGFADDSEYLGPVKGPLVRSVMAVPPCVQRIRDVETFRYVTLLGLLRRDDLALVSVWNPTFFTLLLERLPDWSTALADDVEAGTVSPPGSISPAVRERLKAQWTPCPGRAAAVRATHGDPPPARHRRLWPRLRVVSCWADGSARSYAEALSSLLPHATLQPKGLLATEGVVTIPMEAAPAPVPAVRSHFFEFAPAGGGDPVLLDALETGTRYDVVLTTGGGLYRYQLHDRVEVVDRWRGVPCLRFVGKTDRVVDHFGEKLHAHHVRTVVDAAVSAGEVPVSFALLALENDTPGGTPAAPPAYTLFVETTAPTSALREVGRQVDDGLRENYHYDYCRRLGQLGRLRVFQITGDAADVYLDRCVATGQRAGDVKPTVLHAATDWSSHFDGRFIARSPAPDAESETRPGAADE